MSLNSRQKRTRKRKLAISLLAKSRNPSMIATEGNVRSVWSKTMWTSIRPRVQNWEGSGKRGHVVKGKVKSAPKPSFRADGMPVKLLEQSATNTAQTARVTGPDTLRLAAAKLALRKRNTD